MCVTSRKLKFKDYKNFLEVPQTEIKQTISEKIKLMQIVLKKVEKNSSKQKVNIKNAVNILHEKS